MSIVNFLVMPASIVIAVNNVTLYFKTTLSTTFTIDKFIKYCITGFSCIDHDILKVIDDTSIFNMIQVVCDKYYALNILNIHFTETRINKLIDCDIDEYNAVYNEFMTVQNNNDVRAKHIIAMLIEIMNPILSQEQKNIINIYTHHVSNGYKSAHNTLITINNIFQNTQTVPQTKLIQEVSNELWLAPDANNNITSNLLNSNVLWLDIVSASDYYNFISSKLLGTKNMHTTSDVTSTINVLNINTVRYNNYHRSGWQYVLDNLVDVHDSNDLFMLDHYVDRTFGWTYDFNTEHKIIPYTKPWIGIIHHVANNQTASNVIQLFEKKNFIDSLPFCIGIITLSNKLKNDITSLIKKYITDSWKPLVVNIVHPTEFSNKIFDITKYNNNPQLIQIGSWLRQVYPFYALDCSLQKKNVLIGQNMNDMIPISLIDLENNIGKPINDGDDSQEMCRGETPICRGDINPICRDEPICRGTIIPICRGHHPPICRGPHPPPICRGPHPPPICRGPHPPSIHNSSNKTLESNFKSNIVGTIHKINLSNPNINRFASEQINRGIQLGAYIQDNYVYIPDNIFKQLQQETSSVNVINKVSDDEYDNILSEQVVFLCLMDASAVNTIIECVVRNTPLLINRLPAVEEMLGSSYPMYYTFDHNSVDVTIESVQSVLNIPDIISITTTYISLLDKSKLLINYFTKSLLTSMPCIYGQVYKLLSEKKNYESDFITTIKNINNIMPTIKINGIPITQYDMNLIYYDKIISKITTTIDEIIQKRNKRIQDFIDDIKRRMGHI
jgi:hypothetical protein